MPSPPPPNSFLPFHTTPKNEYKLKKNRFAVIFFVKYLYNKKYYSNFAIKQLYTRESNSISDIPTPFIVLSLQRKN